MVTVEVVRAWLLWLDHDKCGRTMTMIFCGQNMVTIVRTWLLYKDHGYCGRIMVTVVGT